MTASKPTDPEPAHGCHPYTAPDGQQRQESGPLPVGEAGGGLSAALYGELRQLAAAQFRREQAGRTLQATALVHEALLRLRDLAPPPGTNEERRRFFGAAAETMRRILIEQARRRRRLKRGGGWRRVSLSVAEPAAPEPEDWDVEALHAALARLEQMSPDRAEVVTLRFFAGRTLPEVAELLGISLATAERRWSMARAWLYRELSRPETTQPESSENNGFL